MNLQGEGHKTRLLEAFWNTSDPTSRSRTFLELCARTKTKPIAPFSFGNPMEMPATLTLTWNRVTFLLSSFVVFAGKMCSSLLDTGTGFQVPLRITIARQCASYIWPSKLPAFYGPFLFVSRSPLGQGTGGADGWTIRHCPADISMRRIRGTCDCCFFPSPQAAFFKPYYLPDHH
jgi:hypothetical protein